MSSDEIETSETIETSESWMLGLLAPYAIEIRDRGLIVHSELDSRFQLRRGPLLERALEHLFRFVFSTLPNGCEIYLASARAIAAVAPLESGTLTLRWQVAGAAGRLEAGEATAIRPIAGGAAFHAQSSSAVALRQAFSDAGWTFDLEATNGDRELWIRAATR
jgi:hypothetical protein